MIPFPGESLAVWGGLTTGTPVDAWPDIAYRAGSSTFTAGDEVTLSVDMARTYLIDEDTAGVTIEWAFEVLSGSGEFSAVESGDVAAGGTLGSLSVDGAGTYLLPSTITVADILGSGQADLALTCTSGVVVVQQVKLRVWPTGGVLGNLSAPYQPPPVQIGVTLYRSSAPVESISEERTTGELALQAAKATLAGNIGGTPVGEPGYLDSAGWLPASYGVNSRHIYTADPVGLAVGHGGATAVWLERGEPFVPDPEGVFGVDWIYPPNEVPDDPDKWVVVGEDYWGWYQGIVTLIATGGGDLPDEANYRIGGGNVSAIPSPETKFLTLFGGEVNGIQASDPDPKEFELPDIGQDGLLQLVIWHDGMVEPDAIGTITWGVTSAGYNLTTGESSCILYGGRSPNPEDDGTVTDPVKASYTAGAYRYWTLTQPRVIPLRQFHRDDGLGVTPPRAYGGSSRTRTGRAYGYT